MSNRNKNRNETPAAPVTPEATTQAPATTSTASPAKPVTSWTKTLSSGNDQFLVIVMAGKNSVSAYSIYQPRDEKKKPIVAERLRGDSHKFTTMDEGIAYAKTVVEAQVKQGWQLPQPLALKGGFTPKPDAFSATSLPAPRKAVTPAPAAPTA